MSFTSLYYSGVVYLILNCIVCIRNEESLPNANLGPIKNTSAVSVIRVAQSTLLIHFLYSSLLINGTP